MKPLKWGLPNAAARWKVGLLLVYVKIAIDIVFERESFHRIETTNSKSNEIVATIFIIHLTGDLLSVYCVRFAENLSYVTVWLLLHLTFVLLDRIQTLKIKGFKQEVNSLRPRQNGHHFADDIFKCIFINGNVWFPIKISLKFVPWGLMNNIQALVQIMVWRRPGDKPLSEPRMIRLPTHICVARPQWVK